MLQTGCLQNKFSVPFDIARHEYVEFYYLESSSDRYKYALCIVHWPFYLRG